MKSILIFILLLLVLVLISYANGQGSPAASIGAYLTRFKAKKKQREEAQRRKYNRRKPSSKFSVPVIYRYPEYFYYFK